MLRARIIGTGRYLPEKVLTNLDLEKLMDTTDEWIRQRTGIAQRHIAADNEAASDLAVQASQRALEAAGIPAGAIDLVICCTTSPDYLFPATACLIQHRLGATKAAAFDVNAACSGFVYGLATADAFIRVGAYKHVLVVGAEVASNRINWRQRDTAVLFGDGAGAVVLRADSGENGILTSYLGSDGGEADILMLPGGGSRHPASKDNIDTELFDFQMRGPELFKRAVIAFGMAIQKALEGSRLQVEEVDLFVPHQANTRIILAAAERAGLPPDKVFLNIDRVANTTAASIPIALDEAVAVNRIKTDDTVLVASFGAGLTWGSAMIRW